MSKHELLYCTVHSMQYCSGSVELVYCKVHYSSYVTVALLWNILLTVVQV